MKRTVAKSIGNCKTRSEAAWELEAVDAKVALIQALIPLGLQAVQETLEAEVTTLAGARYQRAGRQPGHVRWSQQQGSVYLGDQKLPIRFPCVRDVHTNAEVPLMTYEKLRQPRDLDAGLLRRVLVGLSCGRYIGSALRPCRRRSGGRARRSRAGSSGRARHRSTPWWSGM